MEILYVIFFVLLLIGMGVYLAKYARLLQSIISYSQQHNLELFGTRYSNVYGLMADVSFLNLLWQNECHQKIEDTELSRLVASAHRILRTQVYIGLLVFFVPLVISAIKIIGA